MHGLSLVWIFYLTLEVSRFVQCDDRGLQDKKIKSEHSEDKKRKGEEARPLIIFTKSQIGCYIYNLI